MTTKLSELKLSYYNIIIPVPGDEITLIYNSRTNALVNVDNEVAKELVRAKIDGIACVSIDLQYINTLMEYGIIIPYNIDELAEVKKKDIAIVDKIIDRKDFIELIICPTYACNLRCSYCYEHVIGQDIQKTVSYMNKTVQDQIIRHYNMHCEIYRNQKNTPLLEDKITWYGGEPLLQANIIDNMQSKFNDIALQYGRSIEAMIITNGTLLNKRNQQMLKKNNIKYIQITIDGPPRIHNKRRPCVQEPNQSFEMIINNLKFIDKYFNITIRINIDQNNYLQLNELLSIFSDYKIWPSNNINLCIKNTRIYEHNNVYESFSPLDFNNIEFEFKKKKVELFNEMSGVSKAYVKNIYPTILKKICRLSIHQNACVIGPDGKLFSCWNNVGNDKLSYGKITDIYKSSDVSTNNKFDILAFRKDMSCYICQYLPICSIKCPEVYLRGNKTNLELNCTKWKYILQDVILNEFKEINNRIP